MAKQKAKKKPEFIYEDMYDINIWYFNGWERGEYEDFLYDKYGAVLPQHCKSPAGSVYELHVRLKSDNSESMVYCLWTVKKNDVDTLMHETLHIVFKSLRDVGLTLVPESEEAFTYLFNRLYNLINNGKSKNNK